MKSLKHVDSFNEKRAEAQGKKSIVTKSLPKINWAGVYAVRKFPPGCGRCRFLSQPSIGVDGGTFKCSMSNVSLVLPSEKLSPTTQEFSKTLNNEIELEIQEIADVVNLSSKQPDTHSISTLEKNLSGYHRSRIFAVRDFPAFCGRNAPLPFVSEVPISETMLGLVKGKIVGKAMLEQEIAKTVLLEPRSSVQNGFQSHGIISHGSNHREKELHFPPESPVREQSNLSKCEAGRSSSTEIHQDQSDGVPDCMGERVDEPHLNASENILPSPCRKKKSLDLPSEKTKKATGWKKQKPAGVDVTTVHKCSSELTPGLKMQDTIVEQKHMVQQTLCSTETSDQLVEQINILPMISHRKENESYNLRRKTHYKVSLPPAKITFHRKTDGNDLDPRTKVRETLRFFHAICRKLLQAKESDHKELPRRIDLLAASLLKKNGKYTSLPKRIGSVPGIEVGDEFQFRIELNIVGLHRPIQGGIDYMKQDGKSLATSIVASGGYNDDVDDSDVLIYCGSGGNNVIGSGGNKKPEDQKLENGNLALKTSFDEKNHVRVIRGHKVTTGDGIVRTYIYDGLYTVEKWWQEPGQHGKLVFKFKLIRLPGQPVLPRKLVTKSKKFKLREGLRVQDISKGREAVPICAINSLDTEEPPEFQYITSMIYPKSVNLSTPKGCGCADGCTDFKKCTCVKRNGGEIPYNHNGSIVEAKTIVYECGPYCTCPSSCYNRVSQNGIRFQLEIFKTEQRGWGVRSLNFIPSGSFVCEYIGELLEEKEAERRVGNDEYLFDIGNRYDNNLLSDELHNLVSFMDSRSDEVVEDGFTIDAHFYGNIGRFINHSCSPNLYAQNVLFDHEDNRLPHIMFFAAENIPPLQELSYHYNYVIDQVRDSSGDIKEKRCFCGSVECEGRMY